MRIVVVNRHFETSCHTDSLIIDLDLCSTPEEMIFKSEVEKGILSDMTVSHPSEESIQILTGGNFKSYSKLNFASRKETNSADYRVKVHGTIEYGPTFWIQR